MHSPQPFLRLGNRSFKRNRLVCITTVTVPVGDHDFSICKSWPYHFCKVSGVIGNKQHCFGYRINLFCNCPADRLSHPGCPWFPGEDRIEIGKRFPECVVERALPAPVNSFQGD
jgi:hypothetical protein